jgi:hypothetical protein
MHATQLTCIIVCKYRSERLLACHVLCALLLPATSAVRGMGVFPDLQMLVLAQSTGSLSALPMPTPHNGAVAAPGRSQTFAAVGVPASRTLPFGGGALPSGPGMPALHTWLPRVAQIKAHKNGIETAGSLVSCVELLYDVCSCCSITPTSHCSCIMAQGAPHQGCCCSVASRVRCRQRLLVMQVPCSPAAASVIVSWSVTVSQCCACNAKQ